MILFVEQIPHRRYVNLHELRHLPDYADRAQNRFLFQVGIRGLDNLFHVDRQIAAHFGRQYGAQCAQRQAGNVLIAVQQIAKTQNQ